MSQNNTHKPYDHVVDGVYISGVKALHFAASLREQKIMNLLKLYEDEPIPPADFNTLDNWLQDGEFIPLERMRRGVDFILKHVHQGEKVLVMCGAGISRSSTFVLAYMLEKGYDAREAYFLLRKNHAVAEPHPELWLSLITHYQLKYTIDEVWNWRFEDLNP